MAGPRNLIRNIGLIVVLNLLTKPLWVVVENLVQNALGHATWGAYTAINVLALILGAVTELGINQYSTKTLAAHPERYAELFPRILAIKLGSGLVFMGLLLGAGSLMGYGGVQTGTLLLVGGIQFTIGLTAFWRALMQARQNFRLDTLAGVTDKTIITLPVLVLLHTGISLHSYLWTVLATSVLTLLVFGGIAARRYGIFWPSFRPQPLGGVLQRSMPFALIFLLFLVQERLSALLLERWDGPESAGLFQGAYRFFAMFQMYLWTVLPIFYAKFAQGYLKPTEEQLRLFRAGQGIVAVPMIAVCGFLFFYAEHLFFLFSHSTPAELAQMTACLRILSIALLLNALFNIYSTYLTATGKESYVNLLLILAIPFSTLVTWLFVARLGPQAGAWGILAAFAVLCKGYVYFTYRHTSLPVAWGTLARLLATCLVSGAGYWACTQLGIHWLLAGILVSGLVLGTGFLLKLFDFKLHS
ncbi:MAG: oligosaccharide flippase family protein [Bacteroidetes bacterium]|nr:oligosaccharide flippase family protein [Bacteroidota bacterium]